MPILARINGSTGVVFALILVAVIFAGWRLARRQERRRRSRTTYNFDEHGRIHRVPPKDEEY